MACSVMLVLKHCGLCSAPPAVAVKMLTPGGSQAAGTADEEQQAKLLRQLEKEGAPCFALLRAASAVLR